MLGNIRPVLRSSLQAVLHIPGVDVGEGGAWAPPFECVDEFIVI